MSADTYVAVVSAAALPKKTGYTYCVWRTLLLHRWKFVALWCLMISITVLTGCGGGGAANTQAITSAQSEVVPFSYEVCKGHFILPDSTVGASSELQACIDAGAETLSLPAGKITIDKRLTIVRPIKIQTLGAENRTDRCTAQDATCAHLIAAPGFNDANGLIQIRGTSKVTLSRIVVDGNRIARLLGDAAKQCRTGNNRYGMNLTVHDCNDCTVVGSTFTNALCGTSLEWVGDDASVVNNSFTHNGDSADANMWADGLTLLQANDSHVVDNDFTENSDVGLILGGGRNLAVQQNRISQSEVYAFAGMMLDNFNGSQSGDFSGASITGNTIDCKQCFFGLNVGPLPWYRPPMLISGGKIYNNLVSGGIIGINIDGTSSSVPVQVIGNEVGPQSALAPVRCRSGKLVLTARFSRSPESFVTPDSTSAQVVQSTAGCI